MRCLFLFLDGVGLGPDNPSVNPFARALMPNLQNLLGGKRLLLSALQMPELMDADQSSQIMHGLSRAPLLVTGRATLLALDACLGVAGLPQSASGQAALLTGHNVPLTLGYHYGPKPNPAVAEFLRNGNLFNSLERSGRKTALLNAYPPRYFYAIRSGRRLYSAIPLAVTSAGVALKTSQDLLSGRAIAADFTAQGWRTQLGLKDTPVLTTREAGERLANLARGYDFSLFEYWLSDYAGHGQDMQAACSLLETFDQVLGGLLDAWDDRSGLILFTSDHGNLEDLSTRKHTTNPVPALLIGAPELRAKWLQLASQAALKHSRTEKSRAIPNKLNENSLDLTDIAPAILGLLGIRVGI